MTLCKYEVPFFIVFICNILAHLYKYSFLWVAFVFIYTLVKQKGYLLHRCVLWALSNFHSVQYKDLLISVYVYTLYWMCVCTCTGCIPLDNVRMVPVPCHRCGMWTWNHAQWRCTQYMTTSAVDCVLCTRMTAYLTDLSVAGMEMTRIPHTW